MKRKCQVINVTRAENIAYHQIVRKRCARWTMQYNMGNINDGQPLGTPKLLLHVVETRAWGVFATVSS